jgi:pimeloyl-ACP methyl ester carboxylesterase
MVRAKKSITTPFGDIAYSQQGAGPPALFVHGVFHNGHLWRHAIDGLRDKRRCIAVDLMAHGDTCVAAGRDLSFAAQAEMLDAFCAALDLTAVDVVANDSGAGIAQIFAARHPARIRSLVLTNGDVHDNWPPKGFERTRKAAEQGLIGAALQRMLSDLDFARASFAPGYQHVERISADDFRSSLGPLVSSEQRIADITRFLTVMDCRQTVEVEPLLRRLAAPTLVVWGTADEFFDVKWAYWLKDRIPGCRKVVELRDAKLFFPEERAAEFCGAVRELWAAEA